MREADIYTLMLAIVDQIGAELDRCGLPGLCRLDLQAGAAAVLDFCGGDESGGCDKDCGGQGWVRLETAFPSTEFPDPSPFAQCSAPLAYTLEVGIARCQDGGDVNAISGFVPPSAESQRASASLQMRDMMAMKRAIKAAVGRTDRQAALGSYRNIPQSGDCVGGFWLVTVSEK